MRPALATIVGLVIAAAMLVSPPALADGDPASDILIGENVFYPFSPAVSAGLQKTLNSETAAAHTVHFPIKVALIASPSDLGAIPSLFGKPQQYASFLDQEISFLNIRQLVLVVMPNGYGSQGLNQAAAKAVASLRPPAGFRSNDLAQAAIVAVPTLAAAAGHPIAGVSGGGGADGRKGTTVLEVARSCSSLSSRARHCSDSDTVGHGTADAPGAQSGRVAPPCSWRGGFTALARCRAVPCVTEVFSDATHLRRLVAR